MTSEAHLELKLLGGFEARLQGGAALVLPTKKAQALLAYLALPLGQSHSREKLATLLWGDMQHAQARGNRLGVRPEHALGFAVSKSLDDRHAAGRLHRDQAGQRSVM